MKKFIFFILSSLLFVLPSIADTMPFYTNAIPKDSIGVYQTGDDIILYSKPDEKSNIIKKMNFSYSPETMPDGTFALLLNQRKLGFLYVSDIDEEGWVQVIYDKQTGAKGWVQTVDRMQFLPWLTFYNLYGRKYGLRLFNDAPDSIKTLHAQTDDMSQNLSKLQYVKQIKVTAIRGNWALVSVFDIDKMPKTGYLRWRTETGKIYAFPNIK